MKKLVEKAHRELISGNQVHITLSLGDIIVLPNKEGELWNGKELPNGEFDEEQGYIVVGQTYSYFDGVHFHQFQMEFPEEGAPRIVYDGEGKPKPLYRTKLIPMSYSQFEAGKYLPYGKYLPFPAHIVSRLTFNNQLSDRQLQNSRYKYFKDGRPIYEIKQIIPFISIDQFNKINGTFLEGEETPPPTPKEVNTSSAIKALGLALEEEEETPPTTYVNSLEELIEVLEEE